MSLKVGQVVERIHGKEQYLVIAVDGNNPPIPTNTKMVHLVWKRRRLPLFTSYPQEFISIPLSSFDDYFTENLTRK